MQRTRLRPGTTRVAMVAWGFLAVVAVLWVVSSVVDEASWWIYPFGLVWIMVALAQTYKARRQAVVVDADGMQLLTGLGRTASVSWGIVADISPQPPGEFVSHLAVVLTDDRVLETPLPKGDDRLRELWLSRRQTA